MRRNIKEKQGAEITEDKPSEEEVSRGNIYSANPFEDVSEITSFMRKTLWENAAYTITPGRFSENRDPVEYFLFDKRQGYGGVPWR